jgi:amino acid permease
MESLHPAEKAAISDINEHVTTIDIESSDKHSTSCSADATPPEGEVKPQVHFNLLSCLGLNFSITATPLSVGTYLALAVGVGGPPIFFFEFVFAGFGQLVLALALAELASAIPHSTGAYDHTDLSGDILLTFGPQVRPTGWCTLHPRNWVPYLAT